jgi:hypothetical protein
MNKNKSLLQFLFFLILKNYYSYFLPTPSNNSGCIFVGETGSLFFFLVGNCGRRPQLSTRAPGLKVLPQGESIIHAVCPCCLYTDITNHIIIKKNNIIRYSTENLKATTCSGIFDFYLLGRCIHYNIILGTHMVKIHYNIILGTHMVKFRMCRLSAG